MTDNKNIKEMRFKQKIQYMLKESNKAKPLILMKLNYNIINKYYKKALTQNHSFFKTSCFMSEAKVMHCI